MPDVRLHFHNIVFVSRASTLVNSKVNLKTVFDAIVQGTHLIIDKSHLQHILLIDLSIDILNLDERVLQALNESLLYYITIWPEWQQYSDYKGSYKYWLEMYRMYLMQKMSSVMNEFLKRLEVPAKTVINKTTQTINKMLPNKVAPYTLCVCGPSTILNKLVFIEHNGDIIVKQHADNPWQDLTQVQFLHWPYVSVEVNLPNFSFTRTVSHMYERFIGLKSEMITFTEVNHIKHITKLGTNEEIQPYSYKYFKSYISQLNKLFDKIPFISKDRLLELRLILSHFLKDIQEINIHNKTMSTNVCVGFQIGKCRYIRNKKMISESKNECSVKRAINFFEIVTPQINLALTRFNDQQDVTTATEKNSVNFVELGKLLWECEKVLSEEIPRIRLLINEESIKYSCTLCEIVFTGLHSYDHLSDHFKSFHRPEQSLVCCKCGQVFQFKDLSGLRWLHKCK